MTDTLRAALDDVSSAYAKHRKGKLGPTGVSYALHVAEAALRAALQGDADAPQEDPERDELSNARDEERAWARAAYLEASRPRQERVTPDSLRETFGLDCGVWEDNVAGDVGGPCRRPAGHDGDHDPFYNRLQGDADAPPNPADDCNCIPARYTGAHHRDCPLYVKPRRDEAP